MALKVVWRFIFRVAGHTIGEAFVVEGGGFPGRGVVAAIARAGIVSRRFDGHVAAFTVARRAAINAVGVALTAGQRGVAAGERKERVRASSGVGREQNLMR